MDGWPLTAVIDSLATLLSTPTGLPRISKGAVCSQCGDEREVTKEFNTKQ